MNVFKFGGASTQSAAHINHVVSIIEQYKNEDLLIVISAMGKTTNVLENVWQQFLKHENWQTTLEGLKLSQFELIDELFFANTYEVKEAITDFFDGLTDFLEKNEIENESYIYDQIIALGEITASYIVSLKLNLSDIKNRLVYAKELIRTDFTFREGKVNWAVTEMQIQRKISKGIYVTQGFLGGTENQQNTSLGREGSDYSAAIFATCLNAKTVTIWKDVPGVLNADPTLVPNADFLPKLSYQQAILLTHYGAKVIHPKTIEPLQQKGIVLIVRSFNELDKMGTVISNEVGELPNVFIKNDDQVLLLFKAKQGLLHPRNLSDILYLMKEAQLPPFFIDFNPVNIQISTNNQGFKLDLIKHNLPKELELVEEKPIQMAIYCGIVENAPWLKSIERTYDNGKFKIILGKF